MSSFRLHSFLVTFTARRPDLIEARRLNIGDRFRDVRKMPQRHKDDYPTNGDARQWIMTNEKLQDVQVIKVEECFEDSK